MNLELDAIDKIFDERSVIDSVSLRVDPGAPVTLLGPTGSGKSLLLRIIAGFEPASSGRVRLGGVDITRRSVQRRNVALLTPETLVYPDISVIDNITRPLKLRGVRKAAIRLPLEKLVARLKLEGDLHRRAGETSRSVQARCGLARALARGVDILLVDGAFDGLDVAERDDLRAAIIDYTETGKLCSIIATDEPLEALLAGGRVAVMSDGRVLQVGDAITIHRAPSSARVARILSNPPMNMLNVTVRNGVASTTSGFRLKLAHHLEGMPDCRAQLGIRAHKIRLERFDEDDIELQVTIRLVERHGADTRLLIEHHHEIWALETPGSVAVTPGDQLPVYLDPHHIYAFGDTGALEAAPPALA